MKKVLSLILVAALLVCGVLSATASDISDLEKRKAELESQQEQDKQKLEKQNKAVEDQQTEVDKINEQIEGVSTEIRSCHQNIIKIEKSIATKQTQIDKANKKIDANMDVLRQRLKAIYIAGDVSSLEVILGAKDFSDFLDKLQVVQYVSNHDEELINKIQKQLNSISKEKKELEGDKEDLEEEKSTLETKQEELNTILEENKETLASLKSKADETQMNISLSEEELSGLSSEIQEYYRKQREALAAQQAAAAAAAQSESEGESEGESSGGSANIDTGAATQIEAGGGWVWPTPGAYTITSEFNESRSYEQHGGIDIGASMGTAIYAANSGTVVSSNNSCNHVSSGGNWCDCGGGYGNFVWILHDNGYETIYGHMTTTAVGTGDRVSAGQLIGYVGSSGWSTGPHLHFELRIGGVKSNPLNLF
jgi:murein DD-endopeptidase MepM/ murein hydrolase activator NlpD